MLFRIFSTVNCIYATECFLTNVSVCIIVIKQVRKKEDWSDMGEKRAFKIIGKLLLIGLVTTIIRIIGQLLIPAGSQDVLAPSKFVTDGTMPAVFTIYGIFAYTIIASMFLLVKAKISGNRVVRGFKYAISCCVVWVVYLLEPLPHVAFLDKFTYPIADSIALIALGGLSGILLCEKENKEYESNFKIRIFPTLIITMCFTIGRIIQYRVIGIYSSYNDNKVSSIIWAVFVGFILSFVLQWLNEKVSVSKPFFHILIIGTVLFGVDLLLFNFFMPLVFDADIPDLIIRTCIDFGCVTIGSFSLLKGDRK